MLQGIRKERLGIADRFRISWTAPSSMLATDFLRHRGQGSHPTDVSRQRHPRSCHDGGNCDLGPPARQSKQRQRTEFHLARSAGRFLGSQVGTCHARRGLRGAVQRLGYASRSGRAHGALCVSSRVRHPSRFEDHSGRSESGGRMRIADRGILLILVCPSGLRTIWSMPRFQPGQSNGRPARFIPPFYFCCS